MNPGGKVPAWRFLPMLAIMVAIYLISDQPGDRLPESMFFAFDKVAHGLAYATLAAACLYAVIPCRGAQRRLPTAIGIVLFCLLYGLSDEFHQSFVPDRTASLADVVADLLGAIATATVWLFGPKRPR